MVRFVLCQETLSSLEFRHVEEHGDGHNELEAAIGFRCANPSALKSLDIQLFKAFPNLHKLDAAVVTTKGQSGAKLSPKDNRLSWQ